MCRCHISNDCLCTARDPLILAVNSVSLQDGILVGAVGAYDWNGAVLKETRQGKVIPPKSSYAQEFPEELKNHGAYLGE